MLIGPFKQLVTMDGLPFSGPITDQQIPIISQAGICIEEGVIQKIGLFHEMKKNYTGEIKELSKDSVAVPGFVDAHTHICFGGTRVNDYAKRVSGGTYQQIAASGGGILESVRQTRAASQEELVNLLKKRADFLVKNGVTTCEVKSGYGLTLEDELKQLKSILEANEKHPIDFVSTCLAAHVRPPEFASNRDYLDFLLKDLLPLVKEKKLSNRVDIFADEHAFSLDESRYYLSQAKQLGFQLIVHADQFSRGGALLAAELGALSADHLEQSIAVDAQALKMKNVFPIVLPGATLGLGMAFPPARMLLDEGLPLVIASDWNPGSAPHGYLLQQAAFLGAAQKLSIAETLAAITLRAARALGLNDRGILKVDYLADFSIFECSDYRDIFYYQGSLGPAYVYKKGHCLW